MNLNKELRRTSRAVPKVQNVHKCGFFITKIEDEIRRQRRFADPTLLVVKRKSLRHRSQTQCPFKKLFSQPDRSRAIIRRNKLHDLLEVGDGAIRNQDFETHRGIKAFTSSMGRTRPAFTSLKPRSSAASNAASSGIASFANNSAINSDRAGGSRRAMAVLISSTVFISARHPSPLSRLTQS
jgi:hypothetical protein